MLKEMRALSDDAKAVAAVWFGFSVGQRLIFKMREVKPTDRAQAALDELVNAGAIVRTEGGRGIEYRPCWDLTPFFEWYGQDRKNRPNFQLTEPIQEPRP